MKGTSNSGTLIIPFMHSRVPCSVHWDAVSGIIRKKSDFDYFAINLQVK